MLENKKIHISLKKNPKNNIFTGDMYWVSIYPEKKFDLSRSKVKVVARAKMLKL